LRFTQITKLINRTSELADPDRNLKKLFLITNYNRDP
jgi:hypothetical protein